MHTVNIDAGYYICMSPEKALEKAEKEKKDNYLQTCIYHRSNFTTLLFSVDGIPGVEARYDTRIMDLHPRFKLK